MRIWCRGVPFKVKLFIEQFCSCDDCFVMVTEIWNVEILRGAAKAFVQREEGDEKEIKKHRLTELGRESGSEMKE